MKPLQRLLCKVQLEEKSALVVKLQSQLDMPASSMKGSDSPDSILPGSYRLHLLSE